MTSNPDSNDIKQSAALISKHFGIAQSEFSNESDLNPEFETLLKNLTRVISWLLEKDMERLLNGLYRIDVDEERFKTILFQSPPDQVATEVAKLIIERELKKVEYRKKYSS